MPPRLYLELNPDPVISRKSAAAARIGTGATAKIEFE